MPRIIVKLWLGRNDKVKSNIANTVAEELNVDMGGMLNVIGKVSGEERREKVYKAKIKCNPHI